MSEVFSFVSGCIGEREKERAGILRELPFSFGDLSLKW